MTACLDDRILFIDGDAIVIDKPAGLPVDAPRARRRQHRARMRGARCGSSGRRRRCTGSTRTRRAACCSRATPARARASSRRSKRVAVEKYYLAVIGGEIEEDEGTIDLPLAKMSSAEAGWRMVGDPAGKPARTQLAADRGRDGRTLVEFRR